MPTTSLAAPPPPVTRVTSVRSRLWPPGASHVQGVAVEMPIPTVSGSDLHRLSVEIYLRHHDVGTGVCGQCGQRAPCLPRRHAAAVVMASGEDPLWYDAQASTGPGRNADAMRSGGQHRTSHAMEDGGVPAHEGFHVGGANRRLDLAFPDYER